MGIVPGGYPVGMRYAALASGSSGNCHAFADGANTLLLDAGISLKQIRLRMEALGLDPAQVRGVAISHEHSDHINAIPVLLRNTTWDILATPETLAAVQAIKQIEIPASRWVPLRPGQRLPWNGWEVLPFATPHDAVDSVAFRIEGGGACAAVVTDLGHGTALVEDHCRNLDLLVLEANHDVEMLREGEYPPSLKARILSRVGHLSNEAMGDLLARVLDPRLRTVVLAHLSEQNNHPDLARFAAETALHGSATALHLATQRIPLLVADVAN
jgi:phosphoribosyl 1,2-cyclic phosphodiesterase